MLCRPEERTSMVEVFFGLLFFCAVGIKALIISNLSTKRSSTVSPIFLIFILQAFSTYLLFNSIQVINAGLGSLSHSTVFDYSDQIYALKKIHILQSAENFLDVNLRQLNMDLGGVTNGVSYAYAVTLLDCVINNISISFIILSAMSFSIQIWFVSRLLRLSLISSLQAKYLAFILSCTPFQLHLSLVLTKDYFDASLAVLIFYTAIAFMRTSRVKYILIFLVTSVVLWFDRWYMVLIIYSFCLAFAYVAGHVSVKLISILGFGSLVAFLNSGVPTEILYSGYGTGDGMQMQGFFGGLGLLKIIFAPVIFIKGLITPFPHVFLEQQFRAFIYIIPYWGLLIYIIFNIVWKIVQARRIFSALILTSPALIYFTLYSSSHGRVIFSFWIIVLALLCISTNLKNVRYPNEALG